LGSPTLTPLLSLLSYPANFKAFLTLPCASFLSNSIETSYFASELGNSVLQCCPALGVYLY